MPNLWGASPIGCGEGDHSYVAQTIGRGRPNRRCRNHDGVLDVWAKMTKGAGGGGEARRQAGRSMGAHAGVAGREHG